MTYKSCNIPGLQLHDELQLAKPAKLWLPSFAEEQVHVQLFPLDVSESSPAIE